VSEAITRSALDRKESRGAQFREDYPKKVPAYDRTITVVHKGSDGAMSLAREMRPAVREDLQKIIEESD
jgi:succinate dehydrogenase / fumarate reductase flavoprotein subunit